MSLNDLPLTPLFPVHPWQITELADTRTAYARNATLFALANGTLGVRGAPENGEGDTAGTYINGFYELSPIHYPETAFGFARDNQTLLNVADASGLRLHIDGEWVTQAHVIAHRRTLDMQAGTLTTDQTLSINGQTLLFRTVRLVSLRQEAVFAQSFTLTSQDFSGSIAFHSRINADTRLKKAGSDPRVGSHLQGQVFDIRRQPLDAHSVLFEQATRRSGLALACAVTHVMQPETMPQIADNHPNEETFVYTHTLAAGDSARLEKFAAYMTTQRYQRDALQTLATQQVYAAARMGVTELVRDQRALLDAFWASADVEIEGDDALQQGIRFNLFHLFQSVGRDGRTNIAAKGLTGEGYEGHTFWDTEMYVIPALLHTQPAIVRQLLTYRYHLLERSRLHARELGHASGACFAWRTINGDECSAYFPAGSAQYHINADIAYAIQCYVTVTNDRDFLIRMGAEILIETARLWADLGAFIPNKGFCICGVTGPDEYTALIDNNAYTNWMAQANLRYALAAVERLRTEAPSALDELRTRLTLTDEELLTWRRAADGMYLPYDSERQLYGQDDTFLEKPLWDIANTPADHYPLLLHYHPMVIYRHQVCKQADLVLALYLLGDSFTPEQKKRHFDYYEAVTTHDSSLSACIFGIVASEIGEAAKAYDYFLTTARMDLDNTHHNVRDGVHIANMAGAWLCVVNGFGGLRVVNDTLRLRPVLPMQWTRCRFSVAFQGATLRVEMTRAATTYTLKEGATLVFMHGDQPVTLTTAAPVWVGS